ncbi:MAG: ADP-ribosylation factor-like protein [Candidatus Hodarchaeales archaeon]
MPIPERALDLINKDYLEEDPATININELSGLETTAIKGIGTLYGTKLLRNCGIRYIKELACITEEQIEKLTNDRISPKLIDKWIVAAKILELFAEGMEEPVSSRRICIAGTEAVGKTSIVKSLQQARSFTTTIPTQGASIETLSFLGIDLSVWDLGGQYNFRQMYLDSPGQFLVQTMVLIYVIDVLAPMRIKESIDYLDALISKFKFIQEVPKIYILYNKCDPPSTIEKRRELTIEENLKQIDLKINQYLRKKNLQKAIKTFRTSIYDIPKLVSTFSAIFAEISPVSKILQDTLIYYSDLHDLQASFLIADNGFVISEYSSRLTKERREKLFAIIMERIRETVYSKEEKKDSIVERLDELGGVFLVIQSLSVKDVTLFFSSISSTSETLPPKSREKVTEQIAPWLKNFFSLVSID